VPLPPPPALPPVPLPPPPALPPGPFATPSSKRGGHGKPRVLTTRATVRPHAKRGATTIVFRLTRPAVVRFTILRASPTCERVAVFRVRAHAGVNKVPFRGRLHGRPLSEGTYRLLVRARRARADAAVLRIVVVEGPPPGARRAARRPRRERLRHGEHGRRRERRDRTGNLRAPRHGDTEEPCVLA
jgi:hypothetical protein